MKDFITSIFSPEGHPIAKLNAKHRDAYLRGLGELLSLFAPDSERAKYAYDRLCSTLIGDSLSEAWQNKIKIRFTKKSVDATSFLSDIQNGDSLKEAGVKVSGIKYANEALTLKREGFRFFRMADCFWWDFYRICSLAKIPIEKGVNICVLDAIVNKRNQKYHTSAKALFKGIGNGEYLPSSLMEVLSKEKRFKGMGFIRVLIVGTMSSGKSTLINALAGRKIAKVKTTVCTTALSHFYNRPEDDEILLSDGYSTISGANGINDKMDLPLIGLKFSGSLKDNPVVLMDTPGINYAYDARHREITQKAIASRDYDIIICVVNSAYLESEESQSLVELVSKVKNKKKIFVLNQLDRYDPEDDSIEESIIQFKSVLNKMKTAAYIAPLSARAALLFKLFRKEENLSNSEKTELLEYSRKMANSYYDLGAYANHKPSIENDYEARTGLKYLETIIVNDEDSKN